jgi:hypothetical protein
MDVHFSFLTAIGASKTNTLRAFPPSRCGRERERDPRPCARGGPARWSRHWSRGHGFDPRPCARGDSPFPLIKDYGPGSFRSTKTMARVVSIHAPARGATPAGTTTQSFVQDFDRRPCARVGSPFGSTGRWSASSDVLQSDISAVMYTPNGILVRQQKPIHCIALCRSTL